MKLAEFLRFCETYWGEKYDGTVLAVMESYLDGKSDGFLSAAAKVLTKRFSRTNRVAPGPAEIERFLDEILQEIPRPLCLNDRPVWEKPSAEQREQIDKMFSQIREKWKTKV